MLRFALCLTALLATAPAFAEEALPTPSDAQVDAAMALLKSNHSTDNILAIMDSLAPLEAAAIKRQHPDADEKTVQSLQDLVRSTVVAHQDEILHIYAVGYAQHFTIDELHALTAFYLSDVGKKYITEIPALVKEMTPVGVVYIQKVVNAAVQDAIVRMRQQGAKL
jgi:hypothetical protein